MRLVLRGATLALALVIGLGAPAFAQDPAGGEDAEAEGAAAEGAEGEPAAEAEADAAEGDAAEAEADAGDADPRLQEARERIARGEQLYAEESYEAALAEFNETLDLLRGHQLRFLVLYNIAKCQERLFRYQDALTAYRGFLEQGGAFSELAAEVRAKIELLEGLLGTVTLRVSVPTYEVWVDDRLIGESETEILLPGGSHTVEIRAEGYVPAQQQVNVAAQAERSLTFELERLAEEFEGLSPALFWTGAAVTLLAVAGGAAFGLKALNESNDIDSRDPALATRGEIDDVRRFSRNADIFFGVAGLAATTTIIFALFTDWGGDDEDDPAAPAEDEAEAGLQLRLAPSIGQDGAGLTLGGRF
ncbi:MAG TPA: PEGA domain-containing protein [Polyangiaceae bacterium LLY-WYZ-15_(1-7)]|nr:PEGA domain-containing protein [Polyangiaceae bacterium LLY-WYZ-15_(1-7)]HJL06925.1 PEGA domain-containing protein [Polyangiaceae bacterium LLY-WYZ-15_(1-7)]HJL33656.1 PEGA domain-containing protein [Polyangiaceae bacterium LLY-WYZ-15_(1-7)]HJL37440.1 PEGA domain-containing protein [Polyangiaceae bacterium LLY-WYZ-15_(1-7)]HJL47738.1 PEGA domain-containing protein [Polyangiaceae bacterium LLY-WYZ-15_(1-7)]